MCRTLVAALLCAVVASPAYAVTYKWTDANGRVVYSDIPPQGNVKYETMGAPPPAANPNAVQELAAKDLELRKRQLESVDRDKKAAEKQAELIKKTEQCQRAESNIRQLGADQVALVRYNEKGEAFVVDEVTRRRERTEVEIWVRQNCAGIATAKN
jgi:Skp family chaperone for outer membrane proteins